MFGFYRDKYEDNEKDGDEVITLHDLKFETEESNHKKKI